MASFFFFCLNGENIGDSAFFFALSPTYKGKTMIMS